MTTIDAPASSARAEPRPVRVPGRLARRPLPRLAGAGLTFAAAAAAYMSVRSLDYTAVDGSLRCLEVFHHPSVQYHGINHFLYPVNVLLWTGWLSAIGMTAPSAAGFIAQCQALNVVAAAATLALLFRLIEYRSGSWRAAVFGVVMLGSTRAFVLHATNAAEPMAAVALGTAGVWLAVESVRTRRAVLAGLAGMASALAVASYLTVAPLGVLALGVCAWGPGEARRVRHAAWFAICLVVTVPLVVLAVLTLAGAADGTLATVMTLRDNGVYGGFAVSRAVNLLTGLAQNLVPVLPGSYEGVRWLLTPAAGHTPVVLSIVLLVIAASLAILLRGGTWRALRAKPWAAGTAATLACSAFPLLYRDPLYDKFWLVPLVLLAFLLSSAWSISAASVRQRALVACAVAAMLVCNVASAVHASRTPTPMIGAARVVGSATSPAALVVVGFDRVSTLYAALYAADSRVLVLPAALDATWRRTLREAAATARTGGPPVYFVGVLDLPSKAWSDFLGARVGIPYADFAVFRRESIVVHAFPQENGAVSLRRWNGPLPLTAGRAF